MATAYIYLWECFYCFNLIVLIIILELYTTQSHLVELSSYWN